MDHLCMTKFHHFLMLLIVSLTFEIHVCNGELPRFERACKPDGSVSVMVIGDWGRKGGYNQSRLASQMGKIAEKMESDFIISTGDNFYPNGLSDENDPAFYQSFTDIYKAPALQKKWYSVLGNHDYRGDALAQSSPILKQKDSRWFLMKSYVLNTDIADFFFIDTTPFQYKYFTDPEDHVYDWRDVLPRDEYLSTLIQDLESALLKSHAKWKIVVGHHTIKSASVHGNTPELVHKLLPILEANGVDLYINGHDHCLEHISSSHSPIQFLTSGGGSKAWRGDFNWPNSKEMKFFYDGQGFMSMQINQHEIQINFYDIFGKILHKWSTTKSLFSTIKLGTGINDLLQLFGWLRMDMMLNMGTNKIHHFLMLVIMSLAFEIHVCNGELPRFEQACKGDGSLSVMVIGDWGRKGDYNQSILASQMGKIAEEMESDFIISTGDNFYPNGLSDVNDPAFYQSFSDIYKAPALQKEWYSVLGNHDYRGDALAQSSPILKQKDSRWFLMKSYVLNTDIAEFFFIDTTPFQDKYFTDPEDHVYDWRDVLPRDKYLSTLLQDLELAVKESRAKWKIVVGHHTIKSASHHGNTPELVQKLLPILEANSVDLYINGHDHCLEHISSSDSPLQFLTSGGGSKAWRGDYNWSNSKEMEFFYDGQGFMSMQINQHEIQIIFYDVFGKILHKWSTSKSLFSAM
ncbi:hypothetical protein ACS0TY_025569 [Phlomoides rotata]